VNDKATSAQAIQTLISNVETLAKQSQLALPTDVRAALEKGTPIQSGNFAVKRDEQPDGKGFGLTVTIHIAH
jgi:hypothetical protein